METEISITDIILREAQRLRSGESAVTVEPIESGQGRSHTIHLVTLADSSCIIARVAKTRESDNLERRAVTILNHIKSYNPDCQVPRIYWHNLDQLCNVPSIVLEDLIEGRSLEAWNLDIPMNSRHIFLDSLAQFLLELWSIEAPKSLVAYTHTVPYSKWIEEEMDKAISRCISGTGRWGTTTDYLVMRSLIPDFAWNLDTFTMIGIAHGDMNAYNFMRNEKFELTGVVDWDWTFSAPLPAVVQFPWFIADIPGWHNDGTTAEDTFEDDRNYLVQAFKAKEDSKHLGNSLSDLLASSRERQRFQSAINYRDIHTEFVRSNLNGMSWSLRAEKIESELKKFLIRHPHFENAAEVQQIRSSKLPSA